MQDLQISFDGARGEIRAVKNATFQLERGEFVALVGPSGCGKSTVLNAIAGLLPPTSGAVLINDEAVTEINTEVGYLFQRDALLPWRTVLRNVTLPLVARGQSKASAANQAAEWLEKVGLRGFENHYPHQLSGGMKKRASLAAVLAPRPKLLLMDEPFSALDVQTRELMENELMALWIADRSTVLFVTHDLEEAIGLSDRVVVMSARPSTIKGEYGVPLKRPRDLTTLKFDQQFVNVHRQIWDDLREESLIAYQQSQ
ncbi:MAG TPA: ABC transporter ATP-binding protein [Acidimicrobiia bacterium]|nr:ABC transporter ATP-binding protein [Acidimicrobiia bacterium]